MTDTPREIVKLPAPEAPPYVPDAAHQAVIDRHEAAVAKLDELKAQCDEQCVDEDTHAPHRPALEAAYLEHYAASQARVDHEDGLAAQRALDQIAERKRAKDAELERAKALVEAAGFTVSEAPNPSDG